MQGDLETPLNPSSKVAPYSPSKQSGTISRVERQPKSERDVEAKKGERLKTAMQHDENVRKADAYRWVVLIATAFFSAGLSFGIDTFTFTFGQYRAAFTGPATDGGQGLMLLCAVNVGAVFIARLVNRTTIESEGSGFPEMKAMLFGKVMLNFLTLRALCCKCISLSLGVAAGLPLGKEGPNVHMAACISRALAPDFYEDDAKSPLTGQGRHVKNTKVTYLLLAATSVAVGSSFAAPIGGVIFSLELMLPQIYDTVAFWGCFVSSVSGALVYTVLRTATSGSNTLEPLMTTNLDQGEGATTFRPVSRLCADLLLGVICGVHGGLWILMHAKVGGCMKRWRAKQSAGAPTVPPSPSKAGPYPGASLAAAHGQNAAPKPAWYKACFQWRDLVQILVVVVMNTMLGAYLPLLHGKPQPALISDLFDKTITTDRQAEWALPWASPLFNMFLCYAMKSGMTILALTLPLSAGMVAPVMVIGALIGRCYGMMMPEWVLNFLISKPSADGGYFSSDASSVTEADRAALMARFAIVGAAAHATAISRAFAMAITVYEVLTLPSSLLPLCSSCLAAIFVSNKIALPFFDMNLTGRGLGGISAITHSEYANKASGDIMRELDADADCLHEQTTIEEIRSLLASTDENTQHFAILQNIKCMRSKEGVAPRLKGTITREALQGLSALFERSTAAINLLSADLTIAKDGSTPALVCTNPQSVTSEVFARDVYIIMKATENDVVFVVENNCLQGIIGWKELLGHRLDKPWFG